MVFAELTYLNEDGSVLDVADVATTLDESKTELTFTPISEHEPDVENKLESMPLIPSPFLVSPHFTPPPQQPTTEETSTRAESVMGTFSSDTCSTPSISPVNVFDIVHESLSDTIQRNDTYLPYIFVENEMYQFHDPGHIVNSFTKFMMFDMEISPQQAMQGLYFALC